MREGDRLTAAELAMRESGGETTNEVPRLVREPVTGMLVLLPENPPAAEGLFRLIAPAYAACEAIDDS